MGNDEYRDDEWHANRHGDQVEQLAHGGEQEQIRLPQQRRHDADEDDHQQVKHGEDAQRGENGADHPPQAPARNAHRPDNGGQ